MKDLKNRRLTDNSHINLHGIIEKTSVNGPGERFLVQVQGCTLKCPGCFNPETHSQEPRWLITTEDLYNRITQVRGIEGVTISGGEPALQIEPIIRLLVPLRASGYSVLLFSGRTREEILSMEKGRQLLGLADILIDGPYMERLRTDSGITGSSNQRVILLTDRYRNADMSWINKKERTELIIEPDGTVIVTGFDPP
ncbi:radical SAM protein [bacterium]|nr:radical SAM protein [bacterium]